MPFRASLTHCCPQARLLCWGPGPRLPEGRVQGSGGTASGPQAYAVWGFVTRSVGLAGAHLNLSQVDLGLGRDSRFEGFEMHLNTVHCEFSDLSPKCVGIERLTGYCPSGGQSVGER